MSTALSALTDIPSCYGEDEDLYYGEELNPQDFFGRHKKMLKILEDAYDDVKRTNRFKSVFIRGESGTGKTSLVLALRNTIVLRRKGFFCMGKYSQGPEVCQDPYSAIMAAFSDLCDVVLQASDEEQIEAIKESLGSNGQYLARAVSNISPFLHEKPEFSICDMKDRYILAKFRVACQAFLRAMASDDRPVVLFLDDIQWMDAGSMDLFEAFLQAGDINNFMLVAAYRDEEAERFEYFPQPDEKSNSNIDIHLRNLDFASLQEMISSRYQFISSSLLYNCTKLIFSRTQGNPHYSLELLRSIERENCKSQLSDSSIIFDEGIIINALKKKKKISDSFACLIAQKLALLDPKMQEVLKVACTLGYQFTEDILFNCTVEAFHENGLKSLCADKVQILVKKLVRGHFFTEANGEYQFTHDILQVAVQNLMSWESRASLHVLIGKYFINYSSSNAKHQAAVHLNRAFDMHKESRDYFPIYTPEYYLRLAKINLEAAQYCQQISAFGNSICLLRRGLSFLPLNEKWSTHFALTFRMTKVLARMEFIVGNLNECKCITLELIRRANQIEKIPFIMLKLEVHISANTLDTATAKEMLKELGIDIPNNASLLFQTCRRLMKIRRVIGKRSDEDILNVPCTSDPRIVIGTKMLAHTGGYWLLEKRPVLGLFAAVVAADLSLEVGLTVCSPTILALLGAIEAMIGNTSHATRLLDLALKVLKKVQAKGEELVVTTNAVIFDLYRRKPLRECMCYFDNGIKNAFEMGEVHHMCYCMPICFFLRWIAGDNLQTLMDNTMRKMYDQLKDFGGELSLRCIEPMMQFVTNLRSDSRNWRQLTILTGEIMNEDSFMSNCSAEFKGIQVYVLCCKFLLLFEFGFNEEARNVGAHILGRTGYLHLKKSVFSLALNFYLAMASYRLYASTRKRRYIRTARKCKTVLIQHQLQGNPNTKPFLAIFEATELSLKSTNVDEISKAYNLASQIQVNEGFPHLEGIVYEEAFQAIGKLQNFSRARNFLDKAQKAYKEKWGATAKSNWLECIAVSILR